MALNPFSEGPNKEGESKEILRAFSEEWKRHVHSSRKKVERSCIDIIFWSHGKSTLEAEDLPRSSCGGNSCLIHHDSRFRKLWDSVTCVLLLILAVTLPLSLAFELTSPFLDVMTWIQAIWFLVDVPLNFITTLHSNEAYGTRRAAAITDHCEIAKEYLKGWFWIDLASSMPIDAMINTGRSGTSIAHGLKLLKLFKLLRLLRVDRIIQKFQVKNQIKYSTIAIIKFLMTLLTGAHWLGLIFYLVSIESGCTDPYCSWVLTYAESARYYSPIDGQCFSDAGCEDWSVGSRYVLCLYWAITTMSTIGFGDITPKNTNEMLFTLVAMLMGTVFFAHGLTNMCTILFYHNKFQVDTESAMDELFDYFRRHRIPVRLGEKIQRFIWYKTNGHHCEDHTRYMSELSLQLREDMSTRLLSNAFPIISRSSKYMIFNLFGEHSDLYRRFSMRLSAECHLEDEILVMKGDRIPAIYYIADGSVTYTDRKHSKTIQKHCSFGEIQNVFNGDDYDDSIVIRAASDICVFHITGKEFKEILEEFPFLWKAYRKMLLARRRMAHPDYNNPLDFTHEMGQFLDTIGREAKLSCNMALVFRNALEAHMGSEESPDLKRRGYRRKSAEFRDHIRRYVSRSCSPGPDQGMGEREGSNPPITSDSPNNAIKASNQLNTEADEKAANQKGLTKGNSDDQKRVCRATRPHRDIRKPETGEGSRREIINTVAMRDPNNPRYSGNGDTVPREIGVQTSKKGQDDRHCGDAPLAIAVPSGTPGAREEPRVGMEAKSSANVSLRVSIGSPTNEVTPLKSSIPFGNQGSSACDVTKKAPSRERRGASPELSDLKL